jgi:hypothetical protein
MNQLSRSQNKKPMKQIDISESKHDGFFLFWFDNIPTTIYSKADSSKA